MVEYTFEEFAKEFAEITRERLSKELDSVIVIFGPEGSGKSISALLLAKYLTDTIPSLKFDIYRNIIYHAPEFIKKFNEGNQILVIDEALHLMYSKEHMGNSLIAKELFTGRFRQNVLFIIAQNLRWLDPVIREHRARLFIMTIRNVEENSVLWYVISPDNIKIVYHIIKEHGYSKKAINLIAKKVLPDVVYDVKMDPIKHWLEDYKKVKRINNLLISLLLIHGMTEYKFEKLLAKAPINTLSKDAFVMDLLALIRYSTIARIDELLQRDYVKNDNLLVKALHTIRSKVEQRNVKDLLGDELTPDEQKVLYENYRLQFNRIIARLALYYRDEYKKEENKKERMRRR